MRRFYLLLMFCATALTLFAQEQKVSGTVVDGATGEPLIGVSIVEDGTNNGIVTDIDGNFTIKVNNNATLRFSYIGYATKQIKVKKTNLGNIEMDSETIGLADVTVTGQVAVQRKTPVAVSQVTALEIEERLGAQEFPEVLKNTPGVHANKQGGGWGDSEIYMRGFSSENVAVMVNGVPMNDMEWGGVYWSNWQGLSDVTSVMQTQRGLGASKVSSPSVGGTINIVTKGIDTKKGGSISYAMGNDGYNKVAFSVSTGLMSNGWAITVLGSRTWGDGYVQGTNFTGYNYFANISKRINDQHQLSLTAFGAPQRHYQRANNYGALTMAEWNKVKQYMNNDMHFSRYNPTYGYDDYGNRKSADYNVYHKPQISLNHIWQIDHKSSLSTALYTSIGRGYGLTGESSAFNTYIDANGQEQTLSYSDFNGASYGVLNTKFRRADGSFDYGAVQKLNQESEYGSKLVMAESMNKHNWFGLVSTYTNRFFDCLDVYGGVDLRYYKGMHTTVISDLFGGDYFIDSSRGNVKAENNKKAADPMWKYEKLGVGDVVYRNYDGHVLQEGLFGQAEYNKDSWSAFVSASVSATSYWRVGHFYYDDQRSDILTFAGGTVKAGANYNINSNNNIFLNAGYISRAPKFSYGAFMSAGTSNAINTNAKNEQVASVEIGYGFHNEYINLQINGYFTEWIDKTMTKSSTLSDPAQTEYYMNMTGVNARHMGLELELKARPTKWLDINAMLSVGDWQWDSDNVIGYIYDKHGNPLTVDGAFTTIGAADHGYAIVNMKGIKVGGSAQTTANLGLTFKPFKGFRIGAEYTVYDRNYAYYSFSGSNLQLGKAMYLNQAWRIPTSGSMDIRASYSFPLGKCQATISGNVNNVLNQIYIEKAYNPTNISTVITEVNADNVYFFFSQGRTYNIRLKVSF